MSVFGIQYWWAATILSSPLSPSDFLTPSESREGGGMVEGG